MYKLVSKYLLIILILIQTALSAQCKVEIKPSVYELRIDALLALNAKTPNNLKSNPNCEYLILNNQNSKNYNFVSSEQSNGKDNIGKYKQYSITSVNSGDSINIKKIVKIKIYEEYPGFAIYKVNYVNTGNSIINAEGWVNNRFLLPQKDTAEVFWSFQDASYEERPDWVRKVPFGYSQENFMGMNASDYGGGTPVVDVWNRDYGVAVGHLETVPKLVSLPVKRTNGGVELMVKYEKDFQLKPGDTLSTFTTFIAVHRGDYFHTLKTYSSIMQKKGLKINPAPETSYEPVWCAWGYERNFTVDQILNTLPKVKELGLKWVVLDDGWQTSEGDWYLNPEKFPNGDADMKALVDKIHAAGFKAKLWWAPLAVDPGTDLIKQHPDMLLINKDGKYQDISWWDSYYLCPAYKPTLEYTKKLVEKFIGEWGFDGLKIDGQHLNAAPPCYNPKHHHKYPEESTEAMPAFFKTIYETVEKFNKNNVVEVCPCGTGYNFFMLPYLNQVVASDPVSSWQIRLKGKTFKALMGGKAPYYGDHVELSDSGDDFASTIGIGGIIGTKFVWPVGSHLNTESGDVSLTPEREKEWKKWIDIYEKYKLYEGEYLGELYDIGFDKPETHAIRKDGVMYYAFYADKFEGEVDLRGLKKNTVYEVFNLVNGKKLGEISKNHKLKVSFNKYLLIKVINK